MNGPTRVIECANCKASPLANAMVNFGKVAICDECLKQVLKQWEPRWVADAEAAPRKHCKVCGEYSDDPGFPCACKA